jgi:hypothetical protein
VILPLITGLSPNPQSMQTILPLQVQILILPKSNIQRGFHTVTTFVSQSATQLVVKIPGATTKGKVTLEAASGVQTVSGMDLDVVLPSVTTISPSPVDPLANVTITGTNIDLVSSVTFNNAAAVTSFVSQTATQMVV